MEVVALGHLRRRGPGGQGVKLAGPGLPRMRTQAMLLPRAATWAAASPAFHVVHNAPASTSTAATSWKPASQARCRGVRPREPSALPRRGAQVRRLTATCSAFRTTAVI